MILFYVTYPNIKAAKNMAKALLQHKLIACANFREIESMYWWKDEITEDKEIAAYFKTSYKNAPLVETFIKEHHSYEVPCIMKWEFTCNFEYEKWLRHNITER